MITLVCSFPRAGSSLMMRMLHRGGIPIYGSLLSGEVDFVQGLPKDWHWMRAAEGRCIKILDPQRWTPPKRFNYRIIWMTRDKHQQARSQIKFLQEMFQSNVFQSTPENILRIERSMEVDEPKVLELLATLGPCMQVRFEDMLTNPLAASVAVNEFVGGKLKIDRMPEEIIKRSTDCLPYMLEFEQLSQYPQ